jgi:hypothetical protein
LERAEQRPALPVSQEAGHDWFAALRAQVR